ncbi:MULTISPECIES: cupin domain-containing protein [Acidovorax]|uniref:cupin domain-containing protein n=1 Tax=Acidovorax sp. TaxID=1872122 RepID=UPI0032B27786
MTPRWCAGRPTPGFSPTPIRGAKRFWCCKAFFSDEWGHYPQGSWLRSQRWSQHTPFTGAEDALILVKVGHLGATFLEP